jgi:hypothetical protein
VTFLAIADPSLHVIPGSLEKHLGEVEKDVKVNSAISAETSATADNIPILDDGVASMPSVGRRPMSRSWRAPPGSCPSAETTAFTGGLSFGEGTLAAYLLVRTRPCESSSEPVFQRLPFWPSMTPRKGPMLQLVAFTLLLGSLSEHPCLLARSKLVEQMSECVGQVSAYLAQS